MMTPTVYSQSLTCKIWFWRKQKLDNFFFFGFCSHQACKTSQKEEESGHTITVDVVTKMLLWQNTGRALCGLQLLPWTSKYNTAWLQHLIIYQPCYICFPWCQLGSRSITRHFLYLQRMWLEHGQAIKWVYKRVDSHFHHNQKRVAIPFNKLQSR